MSHYAGPWLTAALHAAMRARLDSGAAVFEGSFDLGRTHEQVSLDAEGWTWRDQRQPWPERIKERTVYVRDGDTFAPLQRFAGKLIKLVPTEWGAPTFEIDGIKMLVSAQLSPIDDARRKVALIEPRGKAVLDCCAGLGYFAACCLDAGVARLDSFEKNEDVLWLRRHNPWSPDPDSDECGGRLRLEHADISRRILALPDAGYDAVLHDPPRFGIAGELYAQSFYDQLFRVLRPGGRLFHYTGAPNAKTSGRDVPGEVMKRLVQSGFRAERALDGLLANRPDARAGRR